MLALPLSGRPDATLADSLGRTALHHLLANLGTPDHVLIQFVSHRDVLSTLFVPDTAGFSPWHYSLRFLRLAVCEAFLKLAGDGRAADDLLRHPDPDGRTALHHVAAQILAVRQSRQGSGHVETQLPRDHFERCMVLWRRCIEVEKEALNVVDKEGNTPFHA